MRVTFGAQNVEVANPYWLSGGVQVLPNLVLPYNRIVIIAFIAVAIPLNTWVSCTTDCCPERSTVRRFTSIFGSGVASTYW